MNTHRRWQLPAGGKHHEYALVLDQADQVSSGPLPMPSSRTARAASSGTSSAMLSTSVTIRGRSTSGNSTCRSSPVAMSTAACPYACAWSRARLVARSERKCGAGSSSVLHFGGLRRRTPGRRQGRGTASTVEAVGRLLPVSHAATAVGLFRIIPARSLLRLPANWRATARRGRRRTTPQHRLPTLRSSLVFSPRLFCRAPASRTAASGNRQAAVLAPQDAATRTATAHRVRRRTSAMPRRRRR